MSGLGLWSPRPTIQTDFLNITCGTDEPDTPPEAEARDNSDTGDAREPDTPLDVAAHNLFGTGAAEEPDTPPEIASLSEATKGGSSMLMKNGILITGVQTGRVALIF